MSESSPKTPAKPEGGPAGGKDDRRARQAEQLRENLRRRKEQARAREDGAKRDSDGDGGISED